MTSCVFHGLRLTEVAHLKIYLSSWAANSPRLLTFQATDRQPLQCIHVRPLLPVPLLWSVGRTADKALQKAILHVHKLKQPCRLRSESAAKSPSHRPSDT